MKKKQKIFTTIICILVVSLIGFFYNNRADSRIVTNVQPDISSDELRAIVVEDFEKSTDWVVGSVPRKNPDPKKDPIPELKLKYIAGGPSDLRVENWTADKKGMSKNKCLGLHFKFRYPGYNSVYIEAPMEVRWDDPSQKVLTYDSRVGKDLQERGLQLPGRVKGLSIWFHGRGDDYKLECWIKDYKGDVHIIKFGSLNFVGWRPLKASIPSDIPQSTENYPQTRVLKIVRFVIRSTPDAYSKDVFMFFDQLKALTETYEVSFDGQDLHKAFEQGSLSSTSTSKSSK